MHMHMLMYIAIPLYMYMRMHMYNNIEQSNSIVSRRQQVVISYTITINKYKIEDIRVLGNRSSTTAPLSAWEGCWVLQYILPHGCNLYNS